MDRNSFWSIQNDCQILNKLEDSKWTFLSLQRNTLFSSALPEWRPWFYILYLLYTNVSQAARTESDAIRDDLNSMRTFILVRWAIYPPGYFITLFAGGVEVQVVRKLVYNVADLVNKVGFGPAAVMAAKKMSDMKLHQAARA